MKFDFSMWNYADIEKWEQGITETVRTWKELGLTIGFSFKYDGKNREKMSQLISECEKEGMQLIIYDMRVFWTRFESSESYIKNVKAAIADFGASPAVYGFYIGDEPDSTQFEAFKKCYKLYKSVTDKVGFINLCFNDALSKNFGGRDKYAEFLGEFAEDAHLDLISNDRYSAMHITEFIQDFKEIGIDKYFYDLNLFGNLARSKGLDFWTSLLSVGHWMYRTPTRADIRWQLATAIAHGANSAQWFFIYQHRFADDYYDYPIELGGGKTQSFYDIKHETYQFKNKVVKKLEGYDFNKVFHITKSYGQTPILTMDCDCELFVRSDHGYNGILTEFKNAEGENKYLLVNNSQETSELFYIEYKVDSGKNYYIWLPSGGTHVVEGKDSV